jgi:hypothetical protein
VLSAFAENALPEAERGPLLQHLGACSDCREILYLALPESPETQKVLLPQPRPFTFRKWALGWGALVASVVVAAVLFTTNRLEHGRQADLKVPATPAATNEPGSAGATKIAADKAPPEFDQLQVARDQLKPSSVAPKMPATLTRSESKSQPEAKHMTAKPQANLDFDESGQVRVAAPSAQTAQNPVPLNSGQADAAQSADSRIQNLPLNGRNPAPIIVTTPGAMPASPPQSVGGLLAGNNAVAYSYSRPDMPNKKSAAGSNLGGMVVDPSGAVVPNARIAVLGPSGEKVVTSGQDGKFFFDTLSPGSYSVKAEATGFRATEIKQVAVLADMPATLQLKLEVGAASEVVEVNGAAPVVAEESANAVEATGASAGYVARPQVTTAELSKAGKAKPRRKDSMVALGTGLPVLQWTLSPEGSVQRSDDSGKTWQGISVAPGATFLALSAGGTNVWVGGKAGALYHSADYGQTWVRIQPATSGAKLDQDIVRVDFPDALNGTVSAANGAVWATSDGGKSWQIR